MIDKIIELYKVGAFKTGLFEKAVNLIREKEVEKLAGTISSALSNIKPEAKGVIDILLNRIKEKPFQAAALGTAAVAAIHGVESAIEDAQKRKEMNNVFNAVMANNPDLDKNKSTEIFKTLAKIAPTLATDKASAEGVLKQMNEFPYMHQEALKNLSQIQKNISESTPKADRGMTKTISDLAKDLAGYVAFGNAKGKNDFES